MAQLPARPATDPEGVLADAATAAGDDAPFVERYLRHVDATALRGRSAEDLVAMATRHREVAATRAPGQTVVDASDGVLHVVTSDRPFLVDSVLGELGSAGIGVSLLLHPLFVVRRDAQGELVEVLDTDPRTPHTDPDLHDESWIRLELADRCDMALVRDRIAEVVDAVAAAVDDWESMRATVTELVQALDEGRGPAAASRRPRPPSSCAGSSTTTSPSSARATTRSTATRSPPSPAAGWACCVTTRRPRRSRRSAAPATRVGAWRSASRTPCCPCTA